MFPRPNTRRPTTTVAWRLMPSRRHPTQSVSGRTGAVQAAMKDFAKQLVDISGVGNPRPVAALVSMPVFRTAVVAAVRHLVRPPAEDHVLFLAPDGDGVVHVIHDRPTIVVADATQEGLSFQAVLSIRRELADACVVALLDEGTRAVNEALALVHAGVDDVYPVGPGGIAAHLLATIIDGAVAQRTVATVLSELQAPVRATLRMFLEQLWLRCSRPVAVSEAAALFHGHPATVRRHLRADGLPSLNRLIVWGRLFHAGRLLQASGRSAREVATLLDFPSDQALRNQLKRYASLTPSDCKLEGVTAVRKAFSRAMSGHP